MMVGGKSMFEALRKKSLKSSLVLTVIFGAIGIGLAVWFAVGTWYVVTGYVSFVDLAPDEISNQWVALNLTTNGGSFAETTETVGNTNQTKTVDLYYIILTGDDYSTDFRFMAVNVPIEYRNRMDQMAQNGYGDSIFLSGRIRKMNDDLYNYFKEYVIDNGFSEEEFEEYSIPYYIKVFPNEQLENVFTVGAFLFGVFLIVIAIIRLVKALTGSYLKQLRADVASIGVSELSADSDWNSAAEICKGVKVGRLFTYYMEGSKPRAIPNTKIMWSYQNTTTHRTNGIKTGTTYSIMVWVDGWKNASNIGVPNESAAQTMLRRFGDQFPWVVLGYSDELRKMYHNNRAQFMQLRYNTMDHSMSMPGFGGF